jgi:hypothetical protein
MKLIVLSLLVIVSACDTPTRARFPSASALGNPYTTDPGGLTPGVTGSTTGTTTGGTTPTPTPGFENCTLAKNYTTGDLGSVGICKSSLDETQIRFVSSISNQTYRVCVIPTYKDSTGSSTYLGDPQCTKTVAEQIYTGRLYKNRPGFSQLPLNGVMMMTEPLLPDYFNCMDAYAKYIQMYCPANPYYAPCVQGATSARTSVCNYFKQKYPSNYLDISL